MAKSPARGRSKVLLNKPTREFEQLPPNTRDPDPNFDLLSEEEKEEIRKDAAAKVDAAEKDRAWQAFLEAETKRLEKTLHPEAHEEEKEIEIDLAIYAPEILLDGKRYLYGRKYTVRKSVYDALNEIMYRTHKHYRETHRDPARALMESEQAIAKGGHSYAVVNGSTGQVTKF
jgi:hypothetical protein